MIKEPIKLSIIFPVYNEAKNVKIMVPVVEVMVEVPHEVLVVYDFPEDTSVAAVKKLQERYGNIRLVHNDIGRGVANAVKKGVASAEGDIVLIASVDELFPMTAIENMVKLIDMGCDIVNCTRYALGGRRFGGSLVGGLLSRAANMLFKVITGSVLSDATTGMKMIKKDVFKRISIEANMGWAFAFEFSIKAQLLNLQFGEVPITSVDRLFGGKSTFKLGPWTREYMKWFLWAIPRLRKLRQYEHKVMRIDKRD